MPSNDPYILQPITLLDAVNIVIGQIGSGAILTLDAINLNSDAEDALKAIHNWSMQVQQDGWQWNTEKAMALDPAPQDDPTHPGGVALPLNKLKVDSVWTSAGINLVERGRWLYKPEGSTYNIGVTVYVDLVVALDFEELPQAARNYITMKAARAFAQGKLNNQVTNAYTGQQEMEALIKLYEAEDESDDYTLLDKNGRFQHRLGPFNRR